MKKTKLINLVSLGFLLLSGCGGDSDLKNKARFDVAVYEKQTLVDSTSNDISSQLNLKSDFMLILYEPTCGCWGTFKNNVVTPLLETQKFPIYFIQTKDTTSYFDGLYEGSPSSLTTPIIGIYENGKLFSKIQYEVGDDRFTNYDAFKSWLDDTIIYPTSLYHVNKEQLNALLKSEKKFYVYYSLATCPDCTFFDNLFLHDYVFDNLLQYPLYIVETNSVGFRINPATNERDNVYWTSMKGLYGLSDTLNHTFGYAGGYVPTIQYIEADGTDYVSQGDISPIIQDMLVTGNDLISLNNNNQYVFSQNFFDGSRPLQYSDINLMDEIIPSSLVSGDGENAKLDGVLGFEKYYAPLAEAFFTYYG